MHNRDTFYGECPSCGVGELWVHAWVPPEWYRCMMPRDLWGKSFEEQEEGRQARIADAMARGILRKGGGMVIPCYRSGNLIGWTMRTENIGYQAAVQQLCEYAEIPFVEEGADRGPNEKTAPVSQRGLVSPES